MVRRDVVRFAGAGANGGSFSPGGLVLKGVDKVLASRYEACQDFAAAQRASNPAASPRSIADLAVTRATKELTTIGAATGATAAVPGAGTAAALAMVAVDITASGARIAEMIMRVGAAYNEPLDEMEQRRAAVLTILLAGAGGAKAVERLAGEVGKGLGKKSLARISGQQLSVINRALGRTIVTKYGTQRGAITLGRAIPFGIGSAIGGGGNFLLARSTGKAAIAFFQD